MFHHTRRAQALLAGAAGLTLLLGVGVAVGAVPKPAEPQNVASVNGGAVTLDPTAAAIADAPTAEETTTVPPTTEPRTTTPPSTAPKAAAATASQPEPAAAVEEAPAPTTPAPTTPAAGPTTAARTNPSTAQVASAISQIASRIPLFGVATDAQARQFGDAVCTAFDQGNTYAQVKTQVLQTVSQLPLVSVKSADADFAIRTAVQLFCPGYSSKLV